MADQDISMQTTQQLPRHVAIIMDGNGRWATSRGLPRFEGHRRGVERVREITRYAGDLGLEYLTLYSFSSENWKRPEAEITELFRLLRFFIRRDLAELHKNNVRIKVIGQRDKVPDDVMRMLSDAQELTKDNTSLTLVIAFNYGARAEITDAVKHIAERVKDGSLDVDAISSDMLDEALYTDGIPDPDMIIRTSGEQRLSNFLLWQAAYSEFVFVQTHWPDFDAEQFRLALQEYERRDRRFGKVSSHTG